MKKTFILAGLGLALGFSAAAADLFSTYTSVTGPGSATNYLIIPSRAGYQQVVQHIDYRNATNVGVLGFQSGAGAYTQTATNTSTAITNQINSTNGLIAGSFLVLERNGVGYIAALVSHGQATNGMGTNIVLASGGWGVAPKIGDSIYQLGSATTRALNVAPFTNSIDGNAIFAGDAGRPVVVWLGPAGLSNYLSVVTEAR